MAKLKATVKKYQLWDFHTNSPIPGALGKIAAQRLVKKLNGEGPDPFQFAITNTRHTRKRVRARLTDRSKLKRNPKSKKRASNPPSLKLRGTRNPAPSMSPHARMKQRTLTQTEYAVRAEIKKKGGAMVAFWLAQKPGGMTYLSSEKNKAARFASALAAEGRARDILPLLPEKVHSLRIVAL